MLQVQQMQIFIFQRQVDLAPADVLSSWSKYLYWQQQWADQVTVICDGDGVGAVGSVYCVVNQIFVKKPIWSSGGEE